MAAVRVAEEGNALQRRLRSPPRLVLARRPRRDMLSVASQKRESLKRFRSLEDPTERRHAATRGRVFCAGHRQFRRQLEAPNNKRVLALHVALTSGTPLTESQLDELLQDARGESSQLKARVCDLINEPYVCASGDSASEMMSYRPATVMHRVAASPQLSLAQCIQRLKWLIARGGDMTVINRHDEGIVTFACVRALACGLSISSSSSVCTSGRTKTTRQQHDDPLHEVRTLIAWLVMNGASERRTNLASVLRPAKSVRDATHLAFRQNQLDGFVRKGLQARKQASLFTLLSGLTFNSPQRASGLHCLTSSNIYDPNLSKMILQVAGYIASSTTHNNENYHN